MQDHLFLKAFSVAIFGTFGINLSLADTITLKSGTVLEGKILKEEGDEYLIEVQVTRSIKDQKVVKKSNVLSIEKTAEDAQPFADLQGILPIGDQMPAKEYQAIINGQLKPFITKFPESKHLPEVKKMLATVEGELQRAEAGDVKLEGKWIAAAEWNANAFDLDSLVLASEMEKAANATAYRRALTIYDELKNTYPTSEGLAKARGIASSILPQYQSIVASMAGKAKEKLAARKRSIENLPLRDRARVRAGFEAELAQHKARVDAAKKEKIRWIPASQYDERTLQSLERVIKSEIVSLGRIRDSRDNLAEIYRDTWDAAGKGDTNAVERALSKFRSKKLNPKYAQLLSDHLAANPAPEPVEETPKPEPKPEPKIEEKPKPKNKPLKKPSSDQELTEPEEESGGLMTIVYVILGIAVIGILAGVLLKSRKSEEEE